MLGARDTTKVFLFCCRYRLEAKKVNDFDMLEVDIGMLIFARGAKY